MKRVRINVTQRDIDEGIACAPHKCPVARAIKRRILRDHLLAVTPSSVAVKGVRHPLTMRLTPAEALTESIKRLIPAPQAATRFIRAFDQGKPVEPFTFILDLPDEVLR